MVEAVVADPNNPQIVAVLRMELLGSLVRDSQGARWVALDDNASIFGNPGLINSLLDTMDEGDSDGV